MLVLRAMMTLFHDMSHKEIEVYADDVIIKSQKSLEHLDELRKFFECLQRYCLKLNPTKCVFGVPAGKLLGFLSKKGIELNQSKIKAMQELPPPKIKKYVMIFLARRNRKKGADHLILKEEVHTMQGQIHFDRARLLCFDLDHPEFEALHVSVHYAFDISARPTQTIKGQALAEHLAENPADKEYKSLTTYFPDEEVLFAREDIVESYPGWRMFFDRAANFKGVGIGAVLILKSGQHYPASTKIRFPCTNNMAEYEACILGIKMAVDMNITELLVIGDSDLLIHQVQGEWSTKHFMILPYMHRVKELCKKFIMIEFKHVPRIQNEFTDAFATLSSMIQHLDKNYIDPIEVEIRDQHAY
uniref:Reverse transcriptase domain-containing protein n=1 Tax=Nicotiana tabacum TaxID=4097 RepID=A0A1S3YYD4_TOBAC|nr:PREDICTED: uncharacterized protein LOC107781017 [Nicotiana tabacum]